MLFNETTDIHRWAGERGGVAAGGNGSRKHFL
jgi:hypothetical protein